MLERHSIMTLGLLLGALLCPGARAETAATDFAGSVYLPRLRAYTLANNPEIQAAAERWRAAQARPSQKGSLPDPMVNTSYHNESFDRLALGETEFAMLRFGAEQEVPFPGKLTLREEGARAEALREGALYRGTLLSVLTRLRISYDDYFLVHRSIETVRKNKEILEKLEKTAEARYQVGEGLQQDVLKAQVEISLLLNRLLSLEQKRQGLAAMLNAILNRPPFASLGDPAPVEKVEFPHTLEKLESVAREQSPSLLAAAASVARAKSGLDLARREYYPDFVLRADYFNKAALMPEWEVGVGVRVPLYFWRKQAFGVEEAAATLNETQADRQATSQEILAKLKDLYTQATTADRLVALYKTAVLPQAELSLKSAIAGYQVGKIDFLTLLNNVTVVLENEIRYYEELTSFDKAIAGLEEVAGLH